MNCPYRTVNIYSSIIKNKMVAHLFLFCSYVSLFKVNIRRTYLNVLQYHNKLVSK